MPKRHRQYPFVWASHPIALPALVLLVVLASLRTPHAAFAQEDSPNAEKAEQSVEGEGDSDAASEGEELPELPDDAVLVVSPEEITLEVGEKATINAHIEDEDGVRLEDHTVVFYSRSRRNVAVKPSGEIEAFGPGDFRVIALVPKDPEERPGRGESYLRKEIEVHIPNPPVETVELIGLPDNLYAGTRIALRTKVTDITNRVREDVDVSFSSADDSVAVADALGFLKLVAPGRTQITVKAEDKTSKVTLRVKENPTQRLEITTEESSARTGDVVFIKARGVNAEGEAVPDLPVEFSVSGTPEHRIIAPGAPAYVYEDGAFVAERSGTYTVTATSGERSAQHSIAVEPRNVKKDIEFVGQGPVRDRHTSDLWVWEGTDGRDYAITGTWGAEGHAYIWDVTAPENMMLIDTVRVDARTVNDVKISEDGKIAIISREGASNRKNGLVILDVSEPQVGVRVLSRYDDQLRGGVHNVFVYEDHVYALSNGRRFDIINIEDPSEPYRVGRFELETQGHSIHDVWVSEGVAYSSNWSDGVVAIDVGGGDAGGAPNNPVMLGSYAYPSGWNHAAYPYRSKSTGKFYVFAGDEAFPYGLSGTRPGEAPPRAAGWIHIIEWDEWNQPKEVARYGVPEAGTHNLWIEDDILYVAYYNGGLRLVDISGELRGDLYRQGREIGMFVPNDPESFMPNAPFVWGPQPYKDHVFFSDWNSGLWAVKVVDPENPDRIIGEPQ